MTSTATRFQGLPAPSGADDVDAAWRALSPRLWVARRDGRHLGAVQHGRRWLASDAESEPLGRYRTFREAQAAVVSPASRSSEARGTAPGGPVLAGAGLVVAALASGGVWAWVALVG